MKRWLFTAPLAVFALAPLGCADDEGSCERIVEACHEKDTGACEPHDCHEFAEEHEGDDAACAEREDSCLSACGAN